MFEKIIISCCLFASSLLSAQITITSADMPNANDAILISVTNTVGVSDPMLADSNYTWDYSFLTPTIQRFEKFDSPTTFTSPYNFFFNTFNTSYGRNNYQFTSAPIPGIQITAAYDFYKESSSQYKQIGAGYVINDVPLPFFFNPVDVIYTFPMNYLNVDSCDYKYGVPIPTIGYYGQKGHRVNTVDGWGTLITPFGTFQTLRIKSTIAAVDTLFLTAFNLDTTMSYPLQYQYKWLATGMKIPVLEIDVIDFDSISIITNVQYIDSARTGVPQVGIIEHSNDKLNIAVYPNPCNDELTVQYNLTTASVVQISITDVIGKIIAIPVDETQASGQKNQRINIHDLHLLPGIYFLNMQENKSVHIKKIVITP